MMGPEPWMAPMWGFWWIFPLMGLLICLAFVVVAVRFMSGRSFMCMGDHGSHVSEETDLRREVRELRAELRQLKETR